MDRRILGLASALAGSCLLVALQSAVPAAATSRAATDGQEPVGATVATDWTSVGPRSIAGLSHGGTGGGAGKLNAVAVELSNPQVMYAAGGVGPGNSGPGSEAGVYMTTDGGASWSQVDGGLTSTAIGALWNLCRCRHNSHYADVRVMPTCSETPSSASVNELGRSA